MDKKRLYQLVKDYSEGDIKEDDLGLLRRFLETEEGADLLYEIWDIDFEAPIVSDDEEVRTLVIQRLVNDSRLKRANPETISKRNWGRYAVAASIVLIAFAVFFWKYRLHDGNGNDQFVQHDNVILPGSNKARIQFEDGGFVELDQIEKDTLLIDRGLHIFKKEDGSVTYAYNHKIANHKEKYNTILTPRGGKFNLTLPDGSKVWLNAGTKLKYPLEFDPSSRTVELDGEAYFDIAPQKKGDIFIPFYVVSGDQKIQVLGTEFNVNTYTSDYKTTLLEGSVAMHYYHSNKSEMLKPSQQATYQSKSGESNIRTVDPYYSIAWRSGKFAFEDASMYDVMDEVARWYDIEVTYEGDMSEVRYSGTISRFEKFEQLLQLIEWTDLVTFKVQGRRVIVMK